MLEIDHLDPKSFGGADDERNLGTACRDCNGGRSNELLVQRPIADRGKVIACPTRHRVATVAAMGGLTYGEALEAAHLIDGEVQWPPRRLSDERLVARIRSVHQEALLEIVYAVEDRRIGLMPSPLVSG